MANSLNQYAVVGFLSELDAHNAMQAALTVFKRWCANCRDLSYCDNNIVYLHSENPNEKEIIENFLLTQKGAQPKGCRCKI